MIHTVLIYPHQGLATVASPVTQFDNALQKTLKDLAATMYHYSGIGLAASQVGIHQRIFVMDTSEQQNQTQFLINPVITHRDGEAVGSEGCLSFPGLYIDVQRNERISVQSQNEKGEDQTLEADGLVARCIQHELDHLDGRVFVDRLSRLKRDRALKKFNKLQKQHDD